MKSMKKSMAITTILMVVLLVVALSTATFAWYTASTTVSVGETEVTAARSDSASIAISTGVLATTTNSSVTLKMDTAQTDGAGVVMPMIPTTVPITIDAAKAANAADPTPSPLVAATRYGVFVTDMASATVGLDNKFSDDATAGSGTPFKIVGVKEASEGASLEGQEGFYIVNTHMRDSVNVEMKVNIKADGWTPVTFTSNEISAWMSKPANSGKQMLKSDDNGGTTYYTRKEAKDMYVATGNPNPSNGSYTNPEDYTYYIRNADIAKNLRIAAFKATSVTDGTLRAQGELLAIWHLSGQKVTYGTITGGTYAYTSGTNANSDLTTATYTNSGTAVSIGSIDAQGNVGILMVAWLDGTSMTSAMAGFTCLFDVSFDKAS